MPVDIRELLEQGAPRPSAGPDLEHIVHRGNRIQSRRAALGVVAAVAALLVVFVALPSLRVDRVEVIDRPPAVLNDQLSDRLDEALQDSSRVHDLPSASAAIIFDDGSVWSHAVGVADADAGAQGGAYPETVYSLDHLGELVTAAVIADLAHEGALSLDDPADELVLGLDAEGVTVRDLLFHVSGLADFAGDDATVDELFADPSRRWSPNELLDRLGPPASEPGQRISYADTDYVVLGQIAVAANARLGGEQSGVAESLQDLVRQRLLEPLDAPSIRVQSDDPSPGPLARGSELPVAPAPDDPLIPFTSWATAGWASTGMAGTAADIAKVAHAIFTDDLPSGASTAPLLDWSYLEGVAEDHDEAAAGLVRSTVAGHEVWKADTGGTPGFRGAVAHIPGAGVTVVELANRGHGEDEGPAPGPLGALVAEIIDDVSSAAAGSAGRDLDVWVTDVADPAPTRLATAGGTDAPLSWSPDGKTVLIQSDRDGNPELYLVGAGDASVQRLTDNVGREGFGSFSPDGQRIAFQSDRDGDQDIYVMGTDGGAVRQLTGVDDRGVDDWLPAWSPDGASIAFVRGSTDGDQPTNQLYVMSADGGDVRILDVGREDVSSPAWSPDGAHIAVAAGRDLLQVEIASGAVAVLTSDPAGVWHPAWSPDGTTLAIATGDIPRDIKLLDVEAGTVRTLVGTDADEAVPTWSPDGSRIAFMSDAD